MVKCGPRSNVMEMSWYLGVWGLGARKSGLGGKLGANYPAGPEVGQLG